MHCPTLNELPPPPPGKTGWPWTEESPQLADTMPDGSPCPRVSIVTPSYNQAQFIEETIRSVLLQGYPDLEYIIVDGGSTDGTVDIIRKYEPWLAYWVSEPDRGQADAINKGFERSSGQFLGWLNSDDFYYPRFVQRMVAAFQSKPDVDFLYGDVDRFRDTGSTRTRQRGEDLPFSEMLRTARVPIPQQSSLWRRSVLERAGGLDVRWRVVLDREFFVRVGLYCRMEYVPGTVAAYRLHSHSKGVSELLRWSDEIPPMYQDFFKRRDLPREVLALKSETMGSAYLYCASIARRCGESRLWFRYTLEAVKQHPNLLFRGRLYQRLGMGVRTFLPENVQKHLRPVYRRAHRFIEWDAQPRHLLSAWRLARLKNRHRGQRCFVVGNGLSLDGMDLRPLCRECVISLNRGYSLLGKFGITPTYHVCVNKMIVARCAGQLAHLPAIKFISWQAREMLPFSRDTILLRALESVCFSKNLQDGVVVQVMPYWPRTLGRRYFEEVWGSGTAVYVALQVAFYLGFRQVVLLGVDHDFRVPGDCLTTNTISSTNDWGEANPARWARFHWRLFDLETSELAYHLARIAFEEDGREIVDATLNGRLEEFRKVRYKDLIKE